MKFTTSTVTIAFAASALVLPTIARPLLPTKAAGEVASATPSSSTTVESAATSTAAAADATHTSARHTAHHESASAAKTTKPHNKPQRKARSGKISPSGKAHHSERVASGGAKHSAHTHSKQVHPVAGTDAASEAKPVLEGTHAARDLDLEDLEELVLRNPLVSKPAPKLAPTPVPVKPARDPYTVIDRDGRVRYTGQGRSGDLGRPQPKQGHRTRDLDLEDLEDLVSRKVNPGAIPKPAPKPAPLPVKAGASSDRYKVIDGDGRVRYTGMGPVGDLGRPQHNQGHRARDLEDWEDLLSRFDATEADVAERDVEDEILERSPFLFGKVFKIGKAIGGGIHNGVQKKKERKQRQQQQHQRRELALEHVEDLISRDFLDYDVVEELLARRFEDSEMWERSYDLLSGMEMNDLD